MYALCKQMQMHYDLVAACVLSLSVWLVVVFIVYASHLSMCLLSLSGCLVCLPSDTARVDTAAVGGR